MKNLFKSLILATMMVCTLSISANAATSGEYTYEVQADGTAKITEYLGAGGAITIPGTVDGMTVTSVGSYLVVSEEDANVNKIVDNSVTSVTFPDSVTTIEERAFYQCFSLTSATFGSGLKEIGERAFYPCKLTSLSLPYGLTSIGVAAFSGIQATTIVIPDSVTYMGGSAFANASATSITLSKNLTSIEAATFKYCYDLTSIVIPEGVTILKDEAFSNCTALTSVTLPSTLLTLGKSSFACCYALTNITCPDGLTQIKESAFEECGALTSITLPDTITHIDDYAFRYCGSLSDIYYAGTQEQWDAIYMTLRLNSGIEQSTIHYGADTTTETVVTPAHSFTDVVADSYYEDAVIWAVNNGVTSGTSATTFAPDTTCTRGQVVTFLWRAMGEPTPSITENPFSDVSETSAFYTAILWAVGEGITTGYSDGTFRPTDTCTTGQVLTFLYRAVGEPDTSYESAYAVGAASAYVSAINWADGISLLDGLTVSISGASPRSDIVTYLYRNAGSPAV